MAIDRSVTLGLTQKRSGSLDDPVTNDKSCLVVILPPNLRLVFRGLVICHITHSHCPAITAEEGGRERGKEGEVGP